MTFCKVYGFSLQTGHRRRSHHRRGLAVTECHRLQTPNERTAGDFLAVFSTHTWFLDRHHLQHRGWPRRSWGGAKGLEGRLSLVMSVGAESSAIGAFVAASRSSLSSICGGSSSSPSSSSESDITSGYSNIFPLLSILPARSEPDFLMCRSVSELVASGDVKIDFTMKGEPLSPKHTRLNWAKGCCSPALSSSSI
ncbi:hypothetical protein DL95DRAFT_385717, partial [Leptodontidium sp. 2 PMI_412]